MLSYLPDQSDTVMEAKFLSQTRSPIPFLQRPRHTNKLKYHSPTVAVLTRTPDKKTEAATDQKNISKQTDELERLAEKTVYQDSWFDLLAQNHLSKSVQAVTGSRNGKSGYESLVLAATDASRKFRPTQQHELVVQALTRAIPKPILDLIKAFPQSTFKREHFAAFTASFFAWLIGPSEVRESEFNGRKEKNVAHVKKCRFLEETNCVGMCTNLCKIPTQTFIKHSFGMPVNMVPNFDDMSCEMIFGQEPPTLTEDPALKQPCYKLCKVNKKQRNKCPG